MLINNFKVVRLAWADRLRNEKKFQMCTPSLGALCGVFIFLIIVFGHASTFGSIYKTDSLFSASGGGWRAYTFHVME